MEKFIKALTIAKKIVTAVGIIVECCERVTKLVEASK